MRALLAIGCNEYDGALKLNGAEVDATRIFDALVRPDTGWYDGARSRLLLSPTLDIVRAALSRALNCAAGDILIAGASDGTGWLHL